MAQIDTRRDRMQIIPISLFVLVGLLNLISHHGGTAAPAATIVISQVYGGGGNAGAPLRHDFIELFNRGDTAVDLRGWSVQYAAATGDTWQVTPLAGSLAPGQYYLVRQAEGAGGTHDLPEPDATGTVALSASAGKVALTKSTAALSGACPTALVDLVGYGPQTDCFEGAGPAPAPGNARAVLRAGDGCEDSNSNSADFITGSPAPRNRQSPPQPCSAMPASPPPAVTSAPALAAPPARIRDIQGAGHISPHVGKRVADIPGIVTATRTNGFYMQDPDPDGDDATSEGIFVFTRSAPRVAVGDLVTVSGTVAESRPGGTEGASNLTVTQITSASVSRRSSGHPLPAPIVIGRGGRIPPSTIIDDDAAGGNVEDPRTRFDPANDGIDFYESLEGMRVQVNNALVVGPTNREGEIVVVADSGADAGPRTARGGLLLGAADSDPNPERIIIDNAIARRQPPAVNVGDTFPGAILGVMDYSRGSFKLLNTQPLPAPVAGGVQREVTTLVGAAGKLTVGTFNVENLAPGDGPERFAALAQAIVSHLRSPDILALEEVQDNTGATNDGVVDADLTFRALIAAIQSAGGPVYDYRQINPVNGQDGGAPGGNIRVGFLFQPSRVTFVDRPGGGPSVATAVAAGPTGPELSSSPGRIAPAHAAFRNSRKPLAGEFLFNGTKLFVIANHFISKGSDQPLFGRSQPPQRPSERQRRQQAEVVHGFVAQILALDPNARVIALGDFNDFESSPVLNLLRTGTADGRGTVMLWNLYDKLPAAERYSYVYQGNSEALDHILVSASLFREAAPQYDVVHVNAEFADQVSDHDPQVALFSLP